jgi:hypothetical protein
LDRQQIGQFHFLGQFSEIFPNALPFSKAVSHANLLRGQHRIQRAFLGQARKAGTKLLFQQLGPAI